MVGSYFEGECAGEWWGPAPAGRRPLRSGLVIPDPGAGTDGLTARFPAGAGVRYFQREGEDERNSELPIC